MMGMHSIPAPGFSMITGEANPPNTKDGYFVQLRSGWVDELGPWPAKGPRWIWGARHDSADIVAVRKA